MAESGRDPAAEAAILARVRANHDEILRSMVAAAANNPFAAETSDDRRVRRLKAKSGLTTAEAVVVDSGILAEAGRVDIDGATATAIGAGTGAERLAVVEALAATAAPARADGREKVWGDTIDFVNVSFLSVGAQVARAVCRVATPSGSGIGTGFLIGQGLFITNHHVIGSPGEAAGLVLEFDYERDLAGNLRSPTRFAIHPGLFLTDHDRQDGLDYTIMQVGQRVSGSAPIESFGFVALSDADDKHMLGEFVNIVQHPAGRFKEVVLRENRLVGRRDFALHYVADTEPGSSGSPVFNSEWQAVALHHWGSPWRDTFGAGSAPIDKEVNEGIRISRIVADIRSRLAGLEPAARARLAVMLERGAAPGFQEAGMSSSAQAQGSNPRIEADGRVTFTLPIELSVRLPGFAGTASAGPAPAPIPPAPAAPPGDTPPAESAALDALKSRKGFDPAFIPGHVVPLPALSAAMRAEAAVNSIAAAGADPVVLPYEHFSIVMNGTRRLAFFTASNIDGGLSKRINSRNEVVPLAADDPGLDGGGESAEATWRDDPRILRGRQTGEDIYSRQKVPGFSDPDDPDRQVRMFQKGHLVRRLDPMWGDDETVRRAEKDSHFYTNAAPQVGFFNQGKAPRDMPGSGGGRLWLGLENYVLRNAIAEGRRICCFTGPLFEAGDRSFRGIKVPGRFFKVAVWADADGLRSLAMIADQRPVISVWPERLFADGEAAAGAEAFQDPDELEKVEDFLSTVAAVEAATGLDFGPAVRAADVRKGERQEAVSEPEGLPVGEATRRYRDPA